MSDINVHLKEGQSYHIKPGLSLENNKLTVTGSDDTAVINEGTLNITGNDYDTNFFDNGLGATADATTRLTISPKIYGHGTIEVHTAANFLGAALEVGAVSSHQTFKFDPDNLSSLQIDHTAGFKATIDNMPSHGIALMDLTQVNGAKLHDDILTLYDNGHVVKHLHLENVTDVLVWHAGGFASGAKGFTMLDGATGRDISMPPTPTDWWGQIHAT